RQRALARSEFDAQRDCRLVRFRHSPDYNDAVSNGGVCHTESHAPAAEAKHVHADRSSPGGATNGGSVGRKELEALIRVLQDQLKQGNDGVALGTWQILYSRDHNAFVFEKCEIGGYCEERPAVVSVSGKILDSGGPLLR